MIFACLRLLVPAWPLSMTWACPGSKENNILSAPEAHIRYPCYRGVQSGTRVDDDVQGHSPCAALKMNLRLGHSLRARDTLVIRYL